MDRFPFLLPKMGGKDSTERSSWLHTLFRVIIRPILILIRYLIKFAEHKLVIFLAGMVVNWKLRKTAYSVPLRRLIFHDWVKLSPSELWSYANHFFGDSGPNDGFTEAFRHHVSYMDHHVEHHWLQFTMNPSSEERVERAKTARRPRDEALVEMIVDWMAAEVAYNHQLPRPGRWSWAKRTTATCGLQKEALALFSALLCALGYSEDVAISYGWTGPERSVRCASLPALLDYFARELPLLDHEKVMTLRRAK
jgi:hypothetical protein